MAAAAARSAEPWAGSKADNGNGTEPAAIQVRVRALHEASARTDLDRLLLPLALFFVFNRRFRFGLTQ